MANYDQYIEALKQKDEAAFEFIYNETKTAIYAMIVSIVKDKETSKDLMQDTYITMLEKINQYEPGKNFLSWLITIARNKAIDHYRREQHEIRVDITSEEMIFPAVNPTGERNSIVEGMLKCLNETERSVFLLHIMQNLTHREISQILKMPLGTTLWHYNKAVNKIKKLK